MRRLPDSSTVVTRTSPARREAAERSADPAAVAMALEQIDEIHPGRLDDGPLLHALVAVTGASRFLTRLLVTDVDALATVADPDRRPAFTAGSADELARWKRHELLRIATRDLTGRDRLEEVGAALARLAEDVLAGALALTTTAASPPLAVIGMGKLGGRELNYASDVDVLFAGAGDPRALLTVARRCYRVDTALRPEGRDGPLVRTLESYEAYWDRWARPWEFQALLKARAVAGDAEIGRAFLDAASSRVWERPFGADELRELRAMKARSEEELARRGLHEREVKRGRGGIRDIEFSVQLLQLVHGRRDADLRSPTTLSALAELSSSGYVGPVDAEALAQAYRFLREVEHRLQLVDEHQVHAVPTDAAARYRLARVMGHRDTKEATALAAFDAELRRHQATVRSIHERLYFRPLLEAFTGGLAMPAEAVAARLSAFGFADADRTRQALAELTRGLTRSSRLMHQMLALLLGWLSEAPNPDLGLLGLRALATGPHRSSRLIATFRDSPEAARRLCILLATSSLLRTGFEHNPDLIAALARDGDLRVSRDELQRRTRSLLGARSDRSERRTGLHRLVATERVRIAAADVLGLDPVEITAASLSALAEAVLGAALAAAEPPLPMAVVAMGRFGGAELSYGSDLDVLFVYDGAGPDDASGAEQTAEAVMHFMNGTTPADRMFTMDAGLRPEGRDGPLARSLDGYRAYHLRWAATWERQALLRARPVAGDDDVARSFMEVAAESMWGRAVGDDEVRDIRRMKARIERERIPAGDDPQFHLKLGRGSLSDVEWTAQLLQLRHRVASPGTMSALDALVAHEALAAEDAVILGEAYRFCEQVRNRWYLVKGSSSDALPARAEHLSHLARSCQTTPAGLREEYRRVTRRSRAVVERLFYGRTV
ncbi:MAG: bifunctional [glutamine synthetase] adenylyltransferase/[glutamine synthetase]-adenylyl-L-tyrosine phosphorylase [Acidimicrobiales bacterium]